MARTNWNVIKRNRTTTHEGGRAIVQQPAVELERSVLACMLWEDTFYECGESIADRIARLTQLVPVKVAVDIAVRARNDMNIRHAPLWVMNHLLPRAEEAFDKNISLSDTLADLLTRPDDLTEMVSLYWKNGRKPLSAQLKKALAKAFVRFDAYQLAKYNRKEAVSLRDVLFLCHAKPRTQEQDALFKALINNTLTPPNTWEVRISAAKGDPVEAKKVWEELLENRKLGALALLRNLRNMEKVNVSPKLIRTVLRERTDWPKISPFQFLSAVNAAPRYLDELETAMLQAARTDTKLGGTTLLLVDASGSMNASLSGNSDVTRLDTAVGLSIVLREVCEDVTIVMYATNSTEIPRFRGFAIGTLIKNNDIRDKIGYGTNTGSALRNHAYSKYDRVIVLTDEQAHDEVPQPTGTGYIINVGSYKPSIAYGHWTSITGWSDKIVKYISKCEGEE